MGDADLLVRAHDLNAAEQILQDFEFRPHEARHSQEWFRAHHHHIVPYISHDHALAVEIHHHVVSSDLPVSLPIDDLWRRSRSTKIREISCRILGPEDFLLHLSLHLAADAFMGKVRVLVDIARFIDQHESDLDWEALMVSAVAYRVPRYVYYSLLMARTMVGAKVPKVVLEQLRTHASSTPFMHRALTRLIRNALMIYDKDSHPWHLWILRNMTGDLLSDDGKIRKVLNIVQRTQTRYLQYSQRHASKEGDGSSTYSTIRYPFYLISKALGLQKSFEKRNGK